MKAQLLLRRVFCSTITPSANPKITHPSHLGQIHEARKLFSSCYSNSVSSINSMVFDEDASQGRCGDASELSKGIRKSTGCSWTQVGDKGHTFVRGGIHHPEQEAIVKFLDEWDELLREAGYNPGCYAEEGEIVDSLSQRYHSERLAVAYGLLKLPEGVPLHVLKNLRVCKDCHAAIRLISKVKEKEIIVRDAKRLHHFKNGECSCKVIGEIQ